MHDSHFWISCASVTLNRLTALAVLFGTSASHSLVPRTLALHIPLGSVPAGCGRRGQPGLPAAGSAGTIPPAYSIPCSIDPFSPTSQPGPFTPPELTLPELCCHLSQSLEAAAMSDRGQKSRSSKFTGLKRLKSAVKGDLRALLTGHRPQTALDILIQSVARFTELLGALNSADSLHGSCIYSIQISTGSSSRKPVELARSLHLLCPQSL